MEKRLVNRREFLRATGTAALAATLPFPLNGAEHPRRPNIILILADDFGYECVGANGGSSYKTPNLDALASKGVRFDYCHSQPLCTPSRVQLMTGLYNKRNYEKFAVLPRKERTFAHLFKEAGYATCVAGKWQLGVQKDSPQHFGFDEACLWHHTRKTERYRNPGMDINGEPVDYTEDEYGPDVVSDFACDFMERNKEKEFLLYYPMILTHDPFEPTPNSASWGEESGNVESPVSSPARKLKTENFPDMVAYMDKIVGKMVSKINELGLSDNTLILFTGDNGTHKDVVSILNGAEYRGGKRLTTDAGTHVPLIAYWEGKSAENSVCSDLIDFSDFLPTICEAAAIDYSSVKNLDGVSFLPQILGKKGSPKDSIFCWFCDQKQDPIDAAEFARDKRFKLYKNGDMYDVVNDPLEKSPLAVESASEEAKSARARLKAVIDRYANVRKFEKRIEPASKKRK